MLAVLCSSPRPPLGVALIGFTIAIFSWVLHLLPYLMFCGMITLSVWPPSPPSLPEVVYHPVDGLPNHVHVVHTRVDSKETRSFELNADLRILIFLLSIPVTSVFDNALFYPARRFFLQTIECWFDMRYVHPAQLTGSWPDTWTPILNALRSCEFVADFIDSVTGRNSGTNLSHTTEPHTSVGTDTSDDSHSVAQSTEQSAPSCQRECASSPEPIALSKPEFSTNVPRARKTFVSRPRVSSQSPWKVNGLGGLSPVSKNLSRIVGTLFHHTPPRKSVMRRRINLMAKDPSPRVPPHVLERLWSSRNEDNLTPVWAPIPSFKTAIRNTVVPWHDGAQMLRSAWNHVSNHLVAAATPEPILIAEKSLPPPCIDSQLFPGTCEALAIEQTQFEQQQCRGYAHSSLTSPLNHVSPPVYDQQEELTHQGFPTAVAPMQHGSHAFFSAGPEQPVTHAFGLSPVLESPLPPFSSLSVAPQEQFTFQLLDHAPMYQFSQDAPRLGPQSAPPTAVFVPHNESSFHSPPSDAPPEAVWSPCRHHQSPTFAPQPRHMEQPFWGLGVHVTGTFTFEVSQVTPCFDFSNHVPPPPHHGLGHTATLPSDLQNMSRSPLQQLSSFDQGIQTPRNSTSQQPQPQETFDSPTSPAKQASVAEPSTKGAKMTVDNSDDDDDDDYSSNSDSDSDSESDSDSDMDSDSDTGTDSEDEDEEDEEDDAMATETISVCKTSSCGAPDASSNAQDDVQPKDVSAPASALDGPGPGHDSDSDSDDGYFEHISTPATAGGDDDDDDDSSSDEDMSDHEEEDRLYWEMLYVPRHRRQQPVSVGSV